MSVVVIDSLARGGSGISPFAITKEADVQSSYLTVADLTARDAIPAWQRLPYMRVYVISATTDYRLDGNINTNVWTDVGTPVGIYQLLSQKGQPNGYVPLESNGKISPAYINNIYTNNSYVVTDNTARNALTTLTGDIVITTSTSKIWVKINDNPPVNIDADFAELSFPGSVLSVNGMTGAVSITIANLLSFGSGTADFNAQVALAPSVTGVTATAATHTSQIATLTTNIANTQTYAETHVGLADLSVIAQNPTGAEVGYSLVWNGTTYTLVDISGGGGSGATVFTDLLDVPSTYTGESLKVVRVNAGETALEFTVVSSGHIIKNAGTPLTARANLNFSNGLTASDNTPDTDVKLGGSLTVNTTISGAFTIDYTNTLTRFASGSLGVRNPANTFDYKFVGSAIVADRNITIPLLTSADVLVTEAFAQSLTNKKLGSLTTNGFVKTSGGDGTLSVDTTIYLPSGLAWLLASGGTLTGPNIITTTGTNNITVNQTALGAGTGFLINSTSTDAASNTQKALEVLQSGVNSNSAQSTYAGYFSNTKTGTTSTNVGLYAVASGGATANWAIVAQSRMLLEATPGSGNNLQFYGEGGTLNGITWKAPTGSLGIYHLSGNAEYLVCTGGFNGGFAAVQFLFSNQTTNDATAPRFIRTSGTTGATGISLNNTDAFNVNQVAMTSVHVPVTTFTPGAHTGMATTAEFNAYNFAGANWTWAAGTIDIQRFTRFRAFTVTTGLATDAYTVYIDPPTGNITNAWALGVNGKAWFSSSGVGLNVAPAALLHLKQASEASSIATQGIRIERSGSSTATNIGYLNTGRFDFNFSNTFNLGGSGNGTSLITVGQTLQIISSASGSVGSIQIVGAGSIEIARWNPVGTGYNMSIGTGADPTSNNTRLQITGKATTTGLTLLLEDSGGTDRFGFTDGGTQFIYTAPANDDALTQVLVRDSGTGEVKYRTAASLGGGGGIGGSITDNQVAVGATTANNIEGSANFTYDLTTFQVNGGTIQGSATTQNIFNTTATTVNLGGAATSLNLGNATAAIVTIRPDTIVGSNTTQNLWNTVATTVNFAGAAGTMAIGGAGVIITFGTGAGGQNFITSSTGTVNFLNTNVTTVNAFGSATTITIGATTGTMNLRNATIVLTQTPATDVGFATSTLLVRDSSGNLDKIVASGGGTTAFLRADGTWVAPPGGGGGISNSAANNEIMKSDGTNAVPSGTFSTTLGDLTLGTGLTGATRTITADGTATDVGLILDTKGAGFVDIAAGAGLRLLNGTQSITYSDATTNTVVNLLQLTRQTSGTPAIGMGVSLSLTTQSFNGSSITSVSTDLTGGSEDFDLVFKNMAGGAVAAEAFRISSIGTIILGTDLVGGSREINTGGSAADVGLNIRPKGAGSFAVYTDVNYLLLGSNLSKIHYITANTASVTTSFTVKIESSGGAPSIGFGNALAFETEVQSSVFATGAYIDTILTNVGAGTEAFDLKVRLMNAGAVAEKWKLSSLGVVTLNDAISAPGSNPVNAIHKWLDGTEKVMKVRDEDGNIYNETPRNGTITIEFYNGGSDLTTGIKDTPVELPYDAVVTGWRIMAYNSSNVLTSTSSVIDILMDDFASLPLTGTDTVAGTDKPTLSAASTAEDATVTYTQLVKGEYIQGEIESIGTGIAKIVVVLQLKKLN